MILVEQFGKKSFIIKKPQKNDIIQAKHAFKRIFRIVNEGQFDVIILDEFNCAMKMKLIKISEVLKMLINKPEYVEIILTGRNAPKEIIRIADLVTEMKEIKHYFKKGIIARNGIEK